MTVKAGKDAAYAGFKSELDTIIADQEEFMNELYVWVQECASLDKAEVTAFFSVKKIYLYIALRQPTTKKKHQTNESIFDEQLKEAQSYISNLAAHLAGCITSSTRFAGILGIPAPKP